MQSILYLTADCNVILLYFPCYDRHGYSRAAVHHSGHGKAPRLSVMLCHGKELEVPAADSVSFLSVPRTAGNSCQEILPENIRHFRQNSPVLGRRCCERLGNIM